MKFFSSCCFAAIIFSFTCVKQTDIARLQPCVNDSIPAVLLGDFKDDYGIQYTVTKTLFTQHPNVQYHIIKWNPKEQYFIAKNDDANPGEQGLYSRIDFMEFTDMEPFKWGFCLTSYNAISDSLAEAAMPADRKNPKTGCGGFPFSRMKRTN